MNKKKLTIITPTYNRAYRLDELYKSLLDQSNDIIWLIVDDGSTDNTEEKVQTFIQQNIIEIQYLKKQNGGKHTALNYGIDYIKTPLTMIVDSDDKLSDNAVLKIIDTYEKYKKNKSIGVFSFLKFYSNGRTVVPVEKDEFISDYIEYRIKGNRPGDMAEVFKTEALKKHKFPVFADEKFLSEDVVWIEIAKEYKTLFTNIPVYECEYLPDGLTANDKPMKFASPLGSMLRGKQLMYRGCGIISNIRGAIIYNCYRLNSTSGGCLSMNSEKNFLSLSQGLLENIIEENGKSSNSLICFSSANGSEAEA